MVYSLTKVLMIGLGSILRSKTDSTREDASSLSTRQSLRFEDIVHSIIEAYETRRKKPRPGGFQESQIKVNRYKIRQRSHKHIIFLFKHMCNVFRYNSLYAL